MDRFDHVVVGAGSAGCVLAARLSEDPQNRVLLLEAGAADGPENMAVPPAWPTLIGSEADWGDMSIPAETECSVPVAGPAGADHSGSCLARDLHRDRTNTARGALDQDGLAGSEAAVVEKALPCGQP